MGRRSRGGGWVMWDEEEEQGGGWMMVDGEEEQGGGWGMGDEEGMVKKIMGKNKNVFQSFDELMVTFLFFLLLTRHDLCFAYGYNDFLLSMYLDLFPQEIVEFLEAADQPRPETIRTNSLKTRRKDLAKVGGLINCVAS